MSFAATRGQGANQVPAERQGQIKGYEAGIGRFEGDGNRPSVGGDSAFADAVGFKCGHG
jgi:hypothetical protein